MVKIPGAPEQRIRVIVSQSSKTAVNGQLRTRLKKEILVRPIGLPLSAVFCGMQVRFLGYFFFHGLMNLNKKLSSPRNLERTLKTYRLNISY